MVLMRVYLELVQVVLLERIYLAVGCRLISSSLQAELLQAGVLLQARLGRWGLSVLASYLSRSRILAVLTGVGNPRVRDT